ncbi:MAG: CoA transferase [Candidatus Binatia bacterium]|nr:CoA transferase [Candidatus Binatia bacterium]
MAFTGLTVIDIATLAAAPQIAAFFGDFGAHVIKVESPRGDPLRRLVDEDGVALQWKLVNRNKECVSLDLTKPGGRVLLDRMLARADVLVCAHTAQRLKRFGLEAEALRVRFPQLVMVNLTAYGTTGPWATRPGSGTLAEATAGLAALTGPEGAPPGLSPVGLGDTLGVMQGIIAALLGLYARGTTSTGEVFDVAMYEPILALLGGRISAAQRAGADPGRHGNRFPTMAPRNTYATGDERWVALTAGTDELVRRVFTVIGRDELMEDARFATNRARVENVDALDEIIGAWIGARPCREVVEAFAETNVSLAAVDGPLGVIENPHFQARESLASVEDPEIGRVVTPAPLPRRIESPGQVRHLGRAIGEDNDAVYGDWLGLSRDERAALAAAELI